MCRQSQIKIYSLQSQTKIYLLQVFSHFPGSRAHHMQQFIGKTNATALNIPPLSPPFPQLFLLSMMPYGMECPCSQSELVSWLCPLPGPCVHPAPHWQGRSKKSLWLCASTTLQQLKSLVCYHHYFHKKKKNPKYCIMQASTKKCNKCNWFH